MQSRKLERQMRLGTLTSRRAFMEREKAMEAARNPGFSKFGDCLVSINSKSDKALTSNLRKLNSEIRRMEIQMNQKIKYFVKNSTVLNHDPLILVNRPPSPELIKRATTISQYIAGDDYPEEDEEENKPGYMRQLRSKTRTPSTLTTIDAFVVKTRKKKNVWDSVMDEKAPREFKSTVRPYAKLTKREVTDLQKGYEFHKPRLDNENYQSDSEDARKSAKKKKSKAPRADDSGDSDLDEISPFITQMASVRKKASNSGKNKPIGDIKLKSPIMAIADENAKDNDRSKTVRFNSPVVFSAPVKRRLKTKSTKVSEF